MNSDDLKIVLFDRATRAQVKNANANISVNQFLGDVYSEVSLNPKITNMLLSNPITWQKFANNLSKVARLGLSVGNQFGHCYLIPYENKGGAEVQIQIGYKGLLKIAYTDDNIANIEANAVHKNDDFAVELGSNPFIKHKINAFNRGEVIGYYAIIKYNTGNDTITLMSRDEIIEHELKTRKKNKDGELYKISAAWQDFFDEMAKKVVIKKALKYAKINPRVLADMNELEDNKFTQDKDLRNVTDKPVAIDASDIAQQVKQLKTDIDKKALEIEADLDSIFDGQEAI